MTPLETESISPLIYIPIVAAIIGFTYYISVTRLSLTIKWLIGDRSRTAHIYWVYTNKYLIWLTDRKFLVSALLLFNYDRMVDEVVCKLSPKLKGATILQLSCAFGDLSNRVARRCVEGGARGVVVSDIVDNEVKHTRRKLRRESTGELYSFGVEDGTNLAHPDQSFDYVILFFLFHELPAPMKVRALTEAARVLKPGGRIIFGEFHRPTTVMLRMSGFVFFKVMEPFAHEMWHDFHPEEVLRENTRANWEFDKKTFLKSNYQVFTATKAS